MAGTRPSSASPAANGSPGCSASTSCCAPSRRRWYSASPFGFTGAVPVNLPLPAKIVTQVLEPPRSVEEFGPETDIAEVDAEIRRRMRAALDELAAQRRFPVIG